MTDWNRATADAYRALDPGLRDTPVRRSDALSRAFGATLVLKDEGANRLGCFKGRGADTFVRLHRESLAAGAVCASAGNFGLAMADAAARHGVPLTVFVSVNANARKVERIRAAGAALVQVGRDFDDAKSRAAAYADERGLRFVEDGEETAISLGAGTIAHEVDALGITVDAWLVPLGNGALIEGIGRYVRTRRNAPRVIGVVSAGATVMRDCWLDRDFDARAARADTIADGIAVRVPVPRAVDALREVADEIVTVDDDALLESMRRLHETTGLAAEPSAVAGLAALLRYPSLAAGAAVATILTGSNLTDGQRSRWLGIDTEHSA